MKTKLVYKAEPFSSLNLLLRILDVAGEALEDCHILAIFQKLQHEACFPVFHVYRKMGYIRSPTIENDIDVLKTAGQISELEGSVKYALTEKGKDEIDKVHMPEEPFQVLGEIVNETKKLLRKQAEELSLGIYLSFQEGF